jgi:hypothetical protein
LQRGAFLLRAFLPYRRRRNVAPVLTGLSLSRLRDVMRMSSLGATSAQPATTTAGGDLMRGFSSLSNRVRDVVTVQAESALD